MNTGAKKLDALTSKRGQKRALAKKLKVWPSRVTLWARGDYTPSLPHRMILEAELGIPLRSWDR